MAQNIGPLPFEGTSDFNNSNSIGSFDLPVGFKTHICIFCPNGPIDPVRLSDFKRVGDRKAVRSRYAVFGIGDERLVIAANFVHVEVMYRLARCRSMNPDRIMTNQKSLARLSENRRR